MQDENKVAHMYVLTNLIPYTFQALPNFVVVIGARLVRLCLQHGMHRWSANVFSAFGFVLCALDRKGYRLGKLVLTIVERYGGRELLPQVHMNFYASINHWIHPLVDCVKNLSRTPAKSGWRLAMSSTRCLHCVRVPLTVCIMAYLWTKWM